MEHFETCSSRAASLNLAETGIVRPNGWRKPSQGLFAAERFADVGEGLSVTKSRAIVAVKKVAAAIGLKSQDLLLLDTFGAVTQPQDWEQGRRPIVWPSNHFLVEQTGFSLATLRRHVRRLCEAGVISMKDSPNGKRWGRRDENGVIIEAYGFDLSPLAARAEEFEALYAALQVERAECASLRNAITVTRRLIRAKIEKAQEARLRGPWGELHEAYRDLVQRLPKRAERVGGLEAFLSTSKALLKTVEQAFEDSFDWPERSDAKALSGISNSKNMKPTSLANDTHIQTTNDPNLVNSNRFETKHAAGVVQETQRAGPAQDAEEVDLDINWSTHGNTGATKRGSDIDIPILMASCPHFAEMARSTGGYLRNWNDVHRAAADLRPIVGISKDAWNVANTVLGPAAAAASIALILDKSTTGEIKSPGGYLRGLIERAQIGELHLERSLYGRLNGGGV